MRKAKVYIDGIEAGILSESEHGKEFKFEYLSGYSGKPVSLTMPISQSAYFFNDFPPFFDGLLPEGFQLEGLLKIRKIDRRDYFSQLVAVGNDMVGNVTVREVEL